MSATLFHAAPDNGMRPAHLNAASDAVCVGAQVLPGVVLSLVLEPALDENYNSVKQNSYDWPAAA